MLCLYLDEDGGNKPKICDKKHSKPVRASRNGHICSRSPKDGHQR